MTCFSVGLCFLINPKVELFVCQSSVAAVEPVMPEKMSRSCEVSDVLLAGHHLGVPQHPHHRLWALQPARLADWSAGYWNLFSCHKRLVRLSNITRDAWYDYQQSLLSSQMQQTKSYWPCSPWRCWWRCTVWGYRPTLCHCSTALTVLWSVEAS